MVATTTHIKGHDNMLRIAQLFPRPFSRPEKSAWMNQVMGWSLGVLILLSLLIPRGAQAQAKAQVQAPPPAPAAKVPTPTPTPTPDPNINAVMIDCFKRGIYKVTGRDLMAAGVALDKVDLNALALEDNGQPVAFYPTGLHDGKFDLQDALYFYAQGGFGITVPYINVDQDFYPIHQRFMLHLQRSAITPVRYHEVQAHAPAAASDQYPQQTVGGRMHQEEDLIWQFFELNGQTNSNTNFLFWSKLTYPASDKTTETQTCNVPMAQIDANRPVKLKALFYATSANPRPNIEHHIKVEVNGQAAGQIRWSGNDQHQEEWEAPAGLFKEGPNTVAFTILEPRDTSAEAKGGKKSSLLIDMVMLDWFDITFQQQTAVIDDENEFLLPAPAQTGQPTHLRLTGFTTPNFLVFDLGARQLLRAKPFPATPTSPRLAINLDVAPSSTTLVAVAEPKVKKPLAVKPAIIKKVFEQPVDCDLLVLTNPAFTETLKPFVEWKRSRGLKVQVTDITDIFNEKSSGYASTEAIRTYIRHVAESQPQGKLKYVLLVGDSCTISKYKTFFPAYSYLQSGMHASDNYFASFDNPRGVPQVAVGRFSVRTPEQLNNIIRKTIDYESGKLNGTWQTRFLVIAAAFSWAREDANSMLNNFIRPYYRDTFVKTEYSNPDPTLHAQLTRELDKQLNAGSLMTFFFGHGGGTVWEVGPSINSGVFQLHLFDQSNVEKLTNTDKPSLVFALTCYTNDFDNPHVAQTLGEAFVNSPGGAIGVLGASGRSSTAQNAQLATRIMTLLQQKQDGRIGDFILQAKRELKTEYINTNYLYIGDPSLEFHLPAHDIQLKSAAAASDHHQFNVSYELPDKLPVPAQLECALIGANDEELTHWTQSAAERKGTLEVKAPDAKTTTDTTNMKLFVYGADTGHASHTGMLNLNPPAPAPVAKSATTTQTHPTTRTAPATPAAASKPTAPAKPASQQSTSKRNKK